MLPFLPISTWLSSIDILNQDDILWIISIWITALIIELDTYFIHKAGVDMGLTQRLPFWCIRIWLVFEDTDRHAIMRGHYTHPCPPRRLIFIGLPKNAGNSCFVNTMRVQLDILIRGTIMLLSCFLLIFLTIGEIRQRAKCYLIDLFFKLLVLILTKPLSEFTISKCDLCLRTSNSVYRVLGVLASLIAGDIIGPVEHTSSMLCYLLVAC